MCNCTSGNLDLVKTRFRVWSFGPSRNDSLIGVPMQFDTKIAIVIRTDLEAWQKLNVASFLTSGIAAAFPECIGESYEDGSGARYLSLIGQPILIYGAPDSP